MPETTYRHGACEMIDYTPSGGNIAAGQVIKSRAASSNTVEIGLACLVAHTPIENNTLGAVSAGGGVYDVINLNNAADYAQVFWDDTNNKVTTVSTNNARFGYIVKAGGGGANSTCRALHVGYNNYPTA